MFPISSAICHWMLIKIQYSGYKTGSKPYLESNYQWFIVREKKKKRHQRGILEQVLFSSLSNLNDKIEE